MFLHLVWKWKSKAFADGAAMLSASTSDRPPRRPDGNVKEEKAVCVTGMQWYKDIWSDHWKISQWQTKIPFYSKHVFARRNISAGSCGAQVKYHFWGRFSLLLLSCICLLQSSCGRQPCSAQCHSLRQLVLWQCRNLAWTIYTTRSQSKNDPSVSAYEQLIIVV